MQISFFVFVLSVCCHYCVCMSLPVRWARQHWSGNRWLVLGGRCQRPLGNTLGNGCYGSCILVVFFLFHFKTCSLSLHLSRSFMSLMGPIQRGRRKTTKTNRANVAVCVVGSKHYDGNSFYVSILSFLFNRCCSATGEGFASSVSFTVAAAAV